MSALAKAALTGGESSAGDYCVWLKDDSGNVTPVIWPHGFRARRDPLILMDENGEVVAREGDCLSLTGGFVPVDMREPCSMGQDQAFLAQVIEKINT
jgi:hypothetical protein